MKYLPWLAGGALAGYLHRNRGRRAPREGLSYFSAKGIEKRREDHAGPGNVYSKDLFVYMPPEEFLALAEPFYRGELDPDKMERVSRLVRENVRLRGTPTLRIDETGQVDGHEGRHRATALLRMGVARIPVLLRARSGIGIRWAEQTDPTAFGYRKKLPSWLLSEKPPWQWPPAEKAAWRQQRVAAPWYTQGPERGQLRPAYRVPSTGRAARGQRNVGTKDRTGVKVFKPAAWPACPTDASDSYCPLHDETYRQFKPGISYEDAASALRDHGGRLGEGSTGAFGKKARHGDVLRLMGVMKTNAWRQRHGCCVVDQDEQWQYQQDWFVSRADPQDPQSWRWAPEPPPNKDLICLTDKRSGPKCFVGTRRRPTGRVRPPLGGADCRDPRSGKFTTCATGDTRLGPRKKKR